MMMTVLDTGPAYRSATIAHAAAQDRRRKSLPLVLLLPTGLLFALLFACAMVVLRISFGVKNAEWTDWSLSAYTSLFDPLYARVFVKTVLLACAGAMISVVIGFPLAFYMARTTSATKRRAVLLCTMLPMLVSLLVQSYGWMAILGPDGMLNRIMLSLTGVPRMTSFLFNDTGVLLGLVQTALPLAVLPIANGLATIPHDLEEAAATLGASRWDTYREVILPIAWPSIVSAALLVFAFNAGAFAVPMLLGGLKVTTVALIIRDHMGPLLDWPFGSALSVGLILTVFAVLLTRRLVLPDRSST
jgi:putative spermidine/putrescine transport system permease protein